MNKKSVFYTLVVVIWISGFSQGFLVAQTSRVTEEEVNIEKVFIEASREKILGNYENAATLYKEVLKRDNSNDAAAYELARMYDVLDKDDKALSSIKMAISIDDQNPWYRTFLADVHSKASRFDKAAKVYEELSAKEPTNSYFLSKWAFHLMKANRPEDALTVYNKVGQITGVNEELARKKHSVYLALNDTENAAAVYKELIEVYPHEVRYHRQLAGFYNRIGEKTLAAEVYKNILELDPNDSEAQLALAGSSKGNMDDIQYLESLKPIFNNPAVKIDAKIKELLPFINKVVETEDKTLGRSVLELSETIEKLHPDEAKGFAASGDILFHIKEDKAALEKYNKALTLDGTVYPVWEQVMFLYTNQEDYAALEEVTQKAFDFFPNQARAYYYNGIASYHLNKNKKAISSWKQALMMSRKNPTLQQDLHYRLGLSYLEEKNFEKSDKAFDKALSINPDNAKLLNNYSYHLAQRGEKLGKAKELAKYLNELKPGNMNYQETYGWVLYKAKDYKEAKTWIGKALKNGGDGFPDTLEHYGDVLFQLGETDEAIEYWRKAQSKGSKSGELEKKISGKGVQ
ncbi:MAG: tetratricopeptide repeat protein [Saprospiraceae bacterium]